MKPKTAPARPPSLAEPWLAWTQHAIGQQPQPLYIYLLVDEDGARLIADGKVPDYVRDQAQRALDWTLTS